MSVAYSEEQVNSAWHFRQYGQNNYKKLCSNHILFNLLLTVLLCFGCLSINVLGARIVVLMLCASITSSCLHECCVVGTFEMRSLTLSKTVQSKSTDSEGQSSTLIISSIVIPLNVTLVCCSRLRDSLQFFTLSISLVVSNTFRIKLLICHRLMFLNFFLTPTWATQVMPSS